MPWNAANICCSCGIIRCMMMQYDSMMHVFIVRQCNTLPVEVVLAWRRTRQSLAGLFWGQGKVHSLPRRSWLTFPLHFLVLLSGNVAPCLAQIAFYFLWMAFYLKWLLPLAALGQASHGFDSEVEKLWKGRLTGWICCAKLASRPASAVHRLVCGFLTFFPWRSWSSWSEHSLQCWIMFNSLIMFNHVQS